MISKVRPPVLESYAARLRSKHAAPFDANASQAPIRRLHVRLEPSLPSPSSLAGAMPVKFHSYEDVSNIPKSVQELVELVKRPLRGTQRLASLPSMTPLALAQLARIPDRGSDADTSTSDDSLNKISSVANLVLLTSKAIEESVHNSVEARPTISHWYTLLRTIAQSCHPDARVM